MLFLLFQIGDDRYALEARSVLEVLPVVNLKRIPRAPSGVAGVFNYHGASVPLIDLTEIALGRPSASWMSTRIILTHVVTDSGTKHMLGLLAEQVMQTMQRPDTDFAESGVSAPGAPWLGPVATDKSGIIQRIDVHRLLPQSLHDQLFAQPVSSV